MKNNCCFLVILFLIISHYHVQSQGLSKGYIINLSNDTIPGYIVDRVDRDMGSVIEFKKELNETTLIKYSTADLKGFGFHYGRVFERMSLVDTAKDTVQVFAKLVLDGRIKLFVWHKDVWDNFDLFLFNSDPKRSVHLTESRNKVIKEENGIQYTIEKQYHVGLLKFVKGDSADYLQEEKKIRYSKPGIIENVLKYNEKYKTKYPVSIYKAQKKVFYDISFGIPMVNAPEGINFRLAFYRNKFTSDKNRVVSYMYGVSYRYQSDKNDNYNEIRQILSIIPVGFNFHTYSGIIRPYIYCGLGLSLFVDSNYQIEDNQSQGTKWQVFVLPAFNIGIGAKIKIASKFILVEVTPMDMPKALSINFGFSF